VREVLHEIGAAATPSIVVFNKCDALAPDARGVLERRFPGAVFVSALEEEGLDTLLARITEEASKRCVTMTVQIPYTRGDIVALAHERAQIISERHSEDGTQLVLRIPGESAQAFEPYRTASQK
jgi:GTP-binding protein HflX